MRTCELLKAKIMDKDVCWQTVAHEDTKSLFAAFLSTCSGYASHNQLMQCLHRTLGILCFHNHTDGNIGRTMGNCKNIDFVIAEFSEDLPRDTGRVTGA